MVSLEDLTEGSDAEMVTGQSASFDLSAPGVLEPITDNEGLELVRPHERSTILFRREGRTDEQSANRLVWMLAQQMGNPTPDEVIKGTAAWFVPLHHEETVEMLASTKKPRASGEPADPVATT